MNKEERRQRQCVVAAEMFETMEDSDKSFYLQFYKERHKPLTQNLGDIIRSQMKSKKEKK